MISVAHVSHGYGARPVLHDLSVQIDKGTFCALLGPNGAGKSTLFSLLCGLTLPDEGRVAIAGHDLARARRRALAALGIVFQQPTLDLDMTVWRNMAYFAGLHGMSGAAARTRSDAALRRMGLADRATDRCRELNGGHRRRLEIARALIHEPPVLLLDEPTVGLDAHSRQSLLDHVHDLASDGLTVLWATHLTDEIRPADRVVILHQGRCRADGTAAALAGDRPLSEAFLSLTAAGAP